MRHQHRLYLPIKSLLLDRRIKPWRHPSPDSRANNLLIPFRLEPPVTFVRHGSICTTSKPEPRFSHLLLRLLPPHPPGKNAVPLPRVRNVKYCRRIFRVFANQRTLRLPYDVFNRVFHQGPLLYLTYGKGTSVYAPARGRSRPTPTCARACLRGCVLACSRVRGSCHVISITLRHYHVVLRLNGDQQASGTHPAAIYPLLMRIV